MKNKKAFTLVELLAVIVILAVILVIAVPQVLDAIKNAKEGSFKSTAILIASTAEKKYTEFLSLGKDTNSITCENVVKLSDKDYGTCTISFDDKGKATIKIEGKDEGKFEGLKCEGTKDNMVCGDAPSLPVVNCTFTPNEEDITREKLYTIKDYNSCYNFFISSKSEEELTEDDKTQADSVCKGNGIPEYGFSTSYVIALSIRMGSVTEQELIDSNVINPNPQEIIKYKPGTEYVNGQYTYRYKKRVIYYTDASAGVHFEWQSISDDGWGVSLSDRLSTEAVTTDLCTYINDIPIVSTSNMFTGSRAASIDASSFNTSMVKDMTYMFAGNISASLDLSNFNTSNVTDMSFMFYGNKSTSLNLSSFDTSNVTTMEGMFSGSKATSLDLSNFDTSNVTNMIGMFAESAATNLDLSSFDTSNVIYMGSMFAESAATNLDLSSFNTSNVSNMTAMFRGSTANSLDLSNFDFSNIDFSNSYFWFLDVFKDAKATTGYVRTQNDANKLNESSGKPSTLTFVVKGS